MTCFWNNLHQVRSELKDRKVNKNVAKLDIYVFIFFQKSGDSNTNLERIVTSADFGYPPFGLLPPKDL
jgi:hypothetical protein